MTESTRITFIGGGNMATALAAGLIADGTNPDDLLVSEPDASLRESLGANLGVTCVADNIAAIADAELVILAIKPQVMRPVAYEIAAQVTDRKPLVLSIAAGLRTTDISRWLNGHHRLVRAMPNTPAMLQAGATGLYADPAVSQTDRDLAERVLRAVSLTIWVEDEDLLDAVTALSGSGPAYFFRVMEAMESAATELGLSEQTARLLTVQTALGAARMALESPDDPATLRRKVTSPGGTTEAALESFERGDLTGLFLSALRSARDRSISLSRELGKE